MRDIGIRLVVDDSQKSKFASIATAAQRAQADLESRLNAPLTQYEYALNRFGGVAARAANIGFLALTAGVGGLALAFKNLGNEFVEVNEKFGSLQITLGSALRSISASRAIVDELAEITAKSPIPFQNLANIASSFAVIPQTNQQLLKQSQDGSLGDPQGFLRRSVRTVEAMRVFRPDQDEESAIFAIREALGGQFRSLVRRFDIPTQFLQTVSKKSTQELKDDPLETFNAIEKAFTSIISPEAVSQFARQPSVLLQNTREQAIDLPLLKLGQEDPTTGRSPYQAMLVRAQRLFDQLVDFMSTNFESRFAGPLRQALSSSSTKVFDSLGKVVGRLLDSAGVQGSGAGVERIVEGIANALIKSAEFLTDLVGKIEKNNLLESAVSFVSGFVEVAKKIIGGFTSLAEITSPAFAIFAATMTPALLNNIGTFIRTLFVTIPKILTGFGGGLGNAIRPPSAGSSGIQSGVSNFSGGFSLLSGNRVGRGQDPFQVPNFLQDRTTGRVEYRNAFLRNRELTETLDPGLTRAGRDAAIERTRVRDIRFLEQNPRAAQNLERQGLAGNRLVGISTAAAREEQFRQNNPAPSVLRRAGTAIGGAAAGAAVGLAAGAAVYFAVEGGVKLYEALTANTRATEENSKITAERTARISEAVFTDQNKDFARLLGQNPAEVAKAQIERTTRAESAQTFLTKLFEGTPESIAGNALDRQNVKGIRAGFGPTKGDPVQQAIAAENQIVARRGFDQTALTGLVESGKIAQADLNQLALDYAKSPVEAMIAFRKKLEALPGGKDVLIREMDAYAKSKFNDLDLARPEGFKKLVDAYGSVRAEILRKLVTGTLNPDSVSEVDALIETQSKVQNLRSRALGVQSITQNSFVAQVHDDSETLYQQNFKPEATASKLGKLAKDVTETRKRMGDLLGDLDGAILDYEKTRNSFLDAQSQFGDVENARKFVATLEKLSPAQKKEQLRTQFTATLADLDDSGQLFTTALQAFAGEFQTFSVNFAKLTKEQFTESKTILDNIASKGRLNQFLPASPRKGLNIRTPLDTTEGTDIEVAQSRLDSLEDFDRTAKDLQVALGRAGVRRTQTGPLVAPFDTVVPFEQRRNPRDSAAAFDKSGDKFLTDIPTFAQTESQEDKVSRRILQFNQEVTIPQQRKQTVLDLEKERFDSLSNAVGPNSTFNPSQLSRSPDIVRKLEEIGLKSDAESRSFATFRETTEEDISRQIKVLEYQKTLTKQKELQAATENKITELQTEQITIRERTRISDFESSLNKDTSFNPVTLEKQPDIAKRLTAAGLSSTIEQRAKDDLFPTLSKGGPLAKIDRQESILQIRKDEAIRLQNTQEVRNIEAQINELYVQRRIIAEEQDIGNLFVGLKEGLITAQENLTNFATMGREVGESIKYSFGDAFASVIDGTKSAGDAFRDFASGVLKEMARIFAQKAAMAFINLAFSAFAGSTASAGGTSAAGATDGSAWGMGGNGFAEGGLITGGSGTKDDVPTMLMGGEYVLRKSAVQAIGVENLTKLNEGKVKMPEFNLGGYCPPEMLPGYAKGGLVTSNSNTSSTKSDIRSLIQYFSEGGLVSNHASRGGHSSQSSSVSSALVQHFAEGGLVQNVTSSTEGESTLIQKFSSGGAVKAVLGGFALDAGSAKSVASSGALGLAAQYAGGSNKLSSTSSVGVAVGAGSAVPLFTDDVLRKKKKIPGYAAGGIVQNFAGDHISTSTGGDSSISSALIQRFATGGLVQNFTGARNSSTSVGDSAISSTLIQKFANGGFVLDIPTVPAPKNFYSVAKYYDSGGKITDGTGAKDDVPAMLMGGEFVINKRAAQSIGYENLERMNEQGRLLALASGGRVPSYTPEYETAPRGSVAAGGSGWNIYHTSTISVTVNQATGKSETTAESSALDGRELAEAIDAMLEEKLQDKFRPGEMFNRV